MYVYVCVCMYVCTYVCMHACMCVCVCVCVYITMAIEHVRIAALWAESPTSQYVCSRPLPFASTMSSRAWRMCSLYIRMCSLYIRMCSLHLYQNVFSPFRQSFLENTFYGDCILSISECVLSRGCILSISDSLCLLENTFYGARILYAT
jgi:hypothetical protein